ncbi:MAG: hypothetical protein LBE13_05175 [Bacteroidales bacterium]|jgi:hypothetical protein|nr:hypothetical protein [Bacteroidales bacterium]
MESENKIGNHTEFHKTRRYSISVSNSPANFMKIVFKYVVNYLGIYILLYLLMSRFNSYPIDTTIFMSEKSLIFSCEINIVSGLINYYQPTVFRNELLHYFFYPIDIFFRIVPRNLINYNTDLVLKMMVILMSLSSIFREKKQNRKWSLFIIIVLIFFVFLKMIFWYRFFSMERFHCNYNLLITSTIFVGDVFIVAVLFCCKNIIKFYKIILVMLFISFYGTIQMSITSFTILYQSYSLK